MLESLREVRGFGKLLDLQVSPSTCHGVRQSVGGLESTSNTCAFHDLKARPAVRFGRMGGFGFDARPWAASVLEDGCAASVLERGRLGGFGRKARPAGRRRSGSEAGCAASVLERGRLGGVFSLWPSGVWQINHPVSRALRGCGVARTRPALGPH